MEVVNIKNVRNRRQLERPAIIRDIGEAILRTPEEVERELVTEWIEETRKLLIRIETAMRITDFKKSR